MCILRTISVTIQLRRSIVAPFSLKALTYLWVVMNGSTSRGFSSSAPEEDPVEPFWWVVWAQELSSAPPFIIFDSACDFPAARQSLRLDTHHGAYSYRMASPSVTLRITAFFPPGDDGWWQLNYHSQIYLGLQGPKNQCVLQRFMSDCRLSSVEYETKWNDVIYHSYVYLGQRVLELGRTFSIPTRWCSSLGIHMWANKLCPLEPKMCPSSN